MDDEFIELFNSGKEPVDVSGYNITDRSLGYYYDIPNGTTIKPGGVLWVVFSCDSNVFQANAGDDIKLFDSSGNLVYEKEYNSTTPNVSLARIPDGGNWTTNQNTHTWNAEPLGSRDRSRPSLGSASCSAAYVAAIFGHISRGTTGLGEGYISLKPVKSHLHGDR